MLADVNSVYIHIPFCKSICSYCDFCKFIYNQKWAVDYLKRLKEEIKDRYMGEKIKTIYIGGGTPSSLSLKEIEYLLALTNLFDKSKLIEFTFECNIEDINADLLDLLKRFNVNRLSIGIESFDENKLSFMKRKTSYGDAIDKMKLIRGKGFNNVNLDLIYGIPNEKLVDLKKDVKLLLSLNPDHISTYSLIIEKNTEIYNKGVMNIPQDLDFEMYDYICKKLSKCGYNHYEVSNFSKDGFESIHNLAYWNNYEYYGFGCGASGYVAGVRYDNTKSLKNYLSGDYKDKEELLDIKSIMDYEVMLGFRKLKGINTKEFHDKYHVNIQDVYPIKPLLKSEELVYENGYVKINPKKIYIMNEILIKLI